MRVMYVAPRYHTNQIPIMKGWKEAGDEVCFVSQYRGGTEDYTVLEPIILGYSAFFRFILHLYRWIKKRMGKYRENDYNFQAKFGFLPKAAFRRLLKERRPELVILRDRSVYNIQITRECKKRGIPCLLYTQSPYLEPPEKKEDPIRHYFRSHTPAVRITPVWGTEGEKKPGTWYVPFVIEPCQSPEEKEQSRSGKEGPVRILGVGKYEPRKHHEMLIRLGAELQEQKVPFQIILAGEAVTPAQKKYLASLREEMQKQGLSGSVELKENLSRTEVYEEYRKADIFLLPSTGEFASVSQLEAMSCSLPVICSDTNGTACYVEPGENGYLFKDNDYEDFARYAVPLILDREKLKKMGQKSWELVQQKYLFSQYREVMIHILESLQTAGRSGAESVTIVYDCPLEQCDKLWVREELCKQGFAVKTVAPKQRLSQVEQRGKAGKLLFYWLTFCQCLKALKCSRPGETVLCWSQWSGLMFQKLPGASRRKIISYNWLTPSSGRRTKGLYASALSNPRFYAVINSEDTREKLKQAYGAGKDRRILFIPDVYDDKEIFKKPVYSGTDRYCFTGGRANRDWPLFLELAKRCPDKQFVGVAVRSDWEESLVIPHNVKMYFDLPPEEYYRFMEQSFVTLFPLKEQKVSGLINIVRSAQSGKMVLTTALPATTMYYPEELKEKLPRAGAVEDWIRELQHIYGEPETEYVKQVESMQEHIKREFSPQMAGERLARVIREC